jgi:hypothetical protein
MMVIGCGGGSGKVATMESSGGSSGKPPGMANGCSDGLAKPTDMGTCKVMRHGIEFPQGYVSFPFHIVLKSNL